MTTDNLTRSVLVIGRSHLVVEDTTPRVTRSFCSTTAAGIYAFSIATEE